MQAMKTVKIKLASVVEAVYREAFLKPDFSVVDTLSYAKSSHGDFASNIALKSAKTLGLKPSEVAEKLITSLAVDKNIKKAEVAGPGFINITLLPEVWRDFASGLQPDFIKTDLGKDQMVNLEFVSANPTGPLVLVNAWAAYYGDVLGNILASQGYEVQREYYVNNIGLQIENLGKSVQAALGKKFTKDEQADFYPGDYVRDIAGKIAQEYGTPERVTSLEAAEVGQKAADTILEAYIKPSLSRLNVEFDGFFLESELDNEATLQRLGEKGVLKKYDGATWLNGAKVGIEKDEVLVRKSGVGTYFLSDISYQLDKLKKRKFDKAVAIFGADHHGHAKRLIKTLDFLGYDSLEILTVQMVRLVKSGKEVKMSKRAGNFVVAEELVDEVPSDVARFFFASHDIGTHMSFDLDIARERTKNNPVFYTMYAYARAHSIIKAAGEASLKPADKITHELTQKEIELLKKLDEVYETVVNITTNYKVHNLVHVFSQLAQSFHEYYESERIIKLEKDEAESKLILITKYIEQCDAIFKLLGVIPQEKM